MTAFNPIYHFLHNGKQYYRQVEHEEQEAEVKYRNGNGKYIIAYRDKPEDWVVVNFQSLETLELKTKNIAA